jgi:HAD superfamily hydrolase (TIGR01509 family)
MASPVVTFDAGQTFIDLDLDFLGARLAERAISVEPEALVRAAPAAWRVYDRLTEEGAQHPWKAFMDALLEGAGVGAGAPGGARDRAPVVDWLYEQQATKNLWRKPIPPMVDLIRDLRARGVRLAVISNSEGHLADLLTEVELAPLFDAIIDSQRVGVAKPDPRIFEIALEQLGAPSDTPLRVHIGDSWAADVEGALAAGWHAIWYRSRAGKAQHDARVPVATDAAQTAAALAALGV